MNNTDKLTAEAKQKAYDYLLEEGNKKQFMGYLPRICLHSLSEILAEYAALSSSAGQEREECPVCYKGKVPSPVPQYDYIDCQYCDGTGRLQSQQPKDFCKDCNGEGVVPFGQQPDDYDVCPTCKGTTEPKAPEAAVSREMIEKIIKDHYKWRDESPGYLGKSNGYIIRKYLEELPSEEQLTKL